MKSVTIVINVEEDKMPSIALGDSLAGGRVTYVSDFDMSLALELAEAALKASREKRSKRALNAILSLSYLNEFITPNR